ncbi:hypothetical protein B0H17DRAFT_1184714 [Mycena rosella]|uniref:Uncharacterized protein n=1 Tax=Mycena rosella TaxID=1033263 RepID=A0AAD7CUG2_MYCRO|nr:hypothetical protein B0H17DRAFT_1184714 [Mycena rosella]
MPRRPLSHNFLPFSLSPFFLFPFLHPQTPLPSHHVGHTYFIRHDPLLGNPRSLCHPLAFGTEECELHVESALRGGGRGGYIYAAITPLSIFGSLGAAKAAFGIIFASSSLTGARTLQNMGFEAKGDALATTMLDGTAIRRRVVFSSFSQHYVRSATYVSVTRPATDHWRIPLPPWDLELLLASYRIEMILRQRLLFKGINDLLNDRKVKLPLKSDETPNTPGVALWKDSYASEACLSSLNDFLLKTPATELRKAAPVIRNLAEILELDRESTATDVAKKLKQSYLANTWAWFIMLPAVFVGFILTIAGYIGCFTIVQNSSTSSDTYIWLGVEVALAVIRIITWALNTPWDDSDGTAVELNLQERMDHEDNGETFESFPRCWEPRKIGSESFPREGCRKTGIILEGEERTIPVPINNAENFDLEFHRVDIKSDPGYAVQLPGRFKVPSEFRMMSLITISLSIDHGGTPFPIRHRGRFAESSSYVRRKNRRPEDLEQGCQETTCPRHGLGKAPSFGSSHAKGTALTLKEFSTCLEIVSGHSASPGLYRYILIYWSSIPRGSVRRHQSVTGISPLSTTKDGKYTPMESCLSSASLTPQFRFVQRTREKQQKEVIDRDSTVDKMNTTYLLGLGRNFRTHLQKEKAMDGQSPTKEIRNY